MQVEHRVQVVRLRPADGLGDAVEILLVDPSALGRLRWFLLASPGLPAPAWLDAAGQSSAPD